MTLAITGARIADPGHVYPDRASEPAPPPLATVVLEGGRIAAILPPDAPVPTAGEVIDADGALALPGLHEHHLHLLATAAARASVDCGPVRVAARGSLEAILRDAAAALPPGRWLRGVGFADDGPRPLDRHVLDRIVPDRPVRVQHRSGALWVLNSAALTLLPDLPHSPDVERDAAGEPTGRLFRMDRLVGAAAGREEPDLAAVGALLASQGITGVTDATPDLDDATVRLLAAARDRGDLPSSLTLLGAPLAGHELVDGGPTERRVCVPPAGVRSGPWKLHLHDHDLPGFDTITGWIADARRARRGVAVHCVTRESLVLTLAAIEAVGPAPGDRIEHASVVPPEIIGMMARLGPAVVTQPGFLATRGDHYARDVDPDDVPHLYPYAGLLAAGVKVAPSSDAPHAPTDPWATIRAAADRRAPSGLVLGVDERVHPAVALAGYLSPADDPGGPPRRLERGAAADLCLVRPAAGDADPRVELTVAAGRITFRAG